MTTALQRAAARRNIKKAIAANRRGGKKHRKSHRSGRSSAGASHSYGIGGAYLDGKVSAQVLSPAIDAGIGALQGGGISTFTTDLRYRFVGPGAGTTVLNAASAIGQRWADKKIGQAAALSRGSITAWASELIPVAETIAAGDRSARGAFAKFNLVTTGYNPNASGFNFREAVPYVGAKYGLGIARKLVNRTKIARPLKKGLSMVGLTA